MTSTKFARPSIVVATKLGELVLTREVDGIIHGSSVNGKPEHEPYVDPGGKEGLRVVRTTELLIFTRSASVE